MVVSETVADILKLLGQDPLISLSNQLKLFRMSCEDKYIDIEKNIEKRLSLVFYTLDSHPYQILKIDVICK